MSDAAPRKFVNAEASDGSGVAYYAVIFTVNVVQVVMYAVSYSLASFRQRLMYIFVVSNSRFLIMHFSADVSLMNHPQLDLKSIHSSFGVMYASFPCFSLQLPY